MRCRSNQSHQAEEDSSIRYRQKGGAANESLGAEYIASCTASNLVVEVR